PIEQNGVAANAICSQRYQSAFAHTCITFRHRTDEIGVSYTFEPRRICRANLIDDSVQRAGVGFPFQVNYSTDNSCFDIIRLDRQRSIQNGNHVRVAPQIQIAERNLLQREKVAGIEFNRVLEIAQTFLLFTLTTVNITLLFEYERIVGKRLLRNFELRQSSLVVKILVVKMLGTRQVRFSRVWTQLESSLDGGLGL